MNFRPGEKRIFGYWLVLVILSFVSYQLIENGGHVFWLFGLLFLKLERIWNVYLELGRGPRALQVGVMAATLLLMLALGIIAF